MSPVRVIARAACVVAPLLLLVLVACRTSHDPVGELSTDGGGDEAAIIEDAAGPVRPPVPAGYDGGLGLGLVDVPDTPCAARGGNLVPLLVDDGGAPAFGTLAKVGTRRAAAAIDGTGFITFDPDGTNVKTTLGLPAPGQMTTIGGQIAFAANQASANVVVQLYDATGSAAGAPITLAAEDGDGIGVGSSDTEALVVWSAPNGVRARGFANGAPAGAAPYDLAKTSLTNAMSAAVAPAGGGLYGVVFSGNDTGTSYQTAFGRGSATTRAGDPANLFSSNTPRQVIALAHTPSGFALLTTVDVGPTSYAMLVLLDIGGHRISAGLKLVGTAGGASLAVNGSEIGVLAHRRETQGTNVLHALEFRSFDANGTPLGPWACMEAAAPGGDLGGALAAEGAGYAAVFRTRSGNTSLARFDRLGTGSL